jgi:hypothetical protein
MFLTSRRKQHRSYYSWNDAAKSRTGKGKPVLRVIAYRNGGFMMNTMPGMEKHLMMLN